MKRVVYPLWQDLWTQNLQVGDLWKTREPKKSHLLLTTWSNEVKWQTKKQTFFPSNDIWPPNFSGSWLMWGESRNEVAQPWSRNHKSNVSNWQFNFFLYKVYTTRTSRVVTYGDRKQLIDSHNSLTI